MDKDIQQKYMEMHMLEQQMQQVHKQMQLLDQQLMELDSTKEAINEISNAEIGTEILVPMSSGIFVKAQIKDNTELIINVGAGVTVKKTIEEAKLLIDEQIQEMNSFKTDLNSNLEKLNQKAHEIEKDIHGSSE